MSFGTLYVGNSGLKSQQLAIDVVANNIANLNTTGFKTSRIHFQETLVRTLQPPREEGAGRGSVNAKQLGLGSTDAAVTRDFRQGTFRPTGIQTDIAIEGEGFFVVQGFDNQPDRIYTRAGAFQIDGQVTGNRIRFANADGNLLLGTNATVSALTGLMTLPSTGVGLAPEVIEVDIASGLPGRATSTIEFRRNLFSLQPLAIDPVTLETSRLGVSNDVRFEFQRANVGARDLYFFRATSPTQTQPNGDPVVLTDTGGGPINGQPIEGIVEFDAGGRIVAWYSNSADSNGDDFLTTAEVAALAPWAERTTTAVVGEAHGTATGTAVPAPFSLGASVLNAGSVVIRSGATVLSNGTDYTVDLVSGAVTPRTVWPAGAITADYTYDTPFFTVGRAGAAFVAEVHGASDGTTVPGPFTLLNPPVDATLPFTIRSNGVPLVEGTDYRVDRTTGVVTPLAVWPAAPPVVGEVASSSPANGVTVPAAFTLTNVPVAANTVSVTSGGVPQVRNLDYTLNPATGTITPLNVWEAGPILVDYRYGRIEVDYSRADTRERIEFDSRASAGNEIVFRSAASQASVAAERRAEGEYLAGISVETYDSRSDAHALAVRFERLERNSWSYEVTPTLRETLDSAVVVDTAFDGGASAATILLDRTQAIALDPSNPNLFDVRVEVDEGGGLVEFVQVAASAPFVQTGTGTRAFKVVGGTGSAPMIALSRDLDMTSTDFRVRVTRTLASPAGSGRLTFDSRGDLASAPTVQALSIPLTLAASPFRPNLDFSRLVQTGANTSATATQDGFRAAAFVTFEFDSRGRIVGFYENGKSQPLAQVLLARFPNPQGLEALGQNVFEQGQNSGDPIVAFSGEEGMGGIRPRTVETSNVDLSVELVDLILFQRVYQFNSRVITAADEMIREAINLKR